MIKKFTQSIADRRIRKNLSAERKVKMVNLNDALKIGILANLNEKNLFLEYRKLANELESRNKEHQIQAIGWYKGKKMPEFIKESSKLKLINSVDYNILYRPKKKSTSIKSFLEVEYDLIIDLTKNNIYPLRKILSLCKSGFKVGSFEYENEAFYDLMIAYRSPKDYTQQIIHYLTLLGKNGK